MSALSVGLFTYSTLPRGSVVHTAYLAEALLEAGCDATVYALDKDDRGFFRPLHAHLRLIPASPTPRSTAELVRVRAAELADYVTRLRPRHDIYHAEDCLTANALLDLCSVGHRIDVVRTVHHVEPFDDPFLAACQERSIREPPVCFVVSDFVEREVLRRFQVQAVRAGNGVLFRRFAEVDATRVEAFARRMGGRPAPVVLAVGGVEERKNTVRLLRAFARVHETLPGAALWILGGATVLDHGATRAAFVRELQALPAAVRAAVTELGVVDDRDVPALFRLANVVVLPSLLEGFGLSALEALAAGVPLAVSRRAPFTEFLDDSCATFVDPLSEEDIARGIHDALGASTARRESGRARARAYSWDRVAARHLDVYQSLKTRSAADVRHI